MKTYPSQFIAPMTITLALITVLIHSGLVEIFRDTPLLLHLAYLVLMSVLCAFYAMLAPFIINMLQQKIPRTLADDTPIEVVPENDLKETGLGQLTKREYEVLNLLSLGYSNSDIAKILVISEHTVNDYTKKIYRKLDVHNRHAAATIFRQNQQ